MVLSHCPSLEVVDPCTCRYFSSFRAFTHLTTSTPRTKILRKTDNFISEIGARLLSMLNSFTNVYTAFSAIQTRRSNMAVSQPEAIGFSGSGARFQRLSDFEKEQDDLQAQIDQENLNAKFTTSQSVSPANRRAKITPDVAGILLENQALEEMGGINWVGKLLEYHQANAINPTAEYSEIEVSPQRFTCSVIIKQNSEPISSLTSFARKKDAKQFISKLAIDWLISQNLMPSTGAVKFPKAPVAPQTPLAKTYRAPLSPLDSTSATISPRERSTSPTSYPGLIPDLCRALGFNVPTYRIVPMVEGSPVYHGFADFGSDPRILGKIGEFRDIYGKKKAREVCAREVWYFLKDIERQRLEGTENQEMEIKRKREETRQNPDVKGQSHIVAGI
ncbi:595de35d-e164-4649-8e05-f4ded1339401 [Sclerotinia trifoliorum]|uniref:595de35d-e164-4649-8e05-f4ded1339401 n=1 Tax=Sclerotinia trifoliorum TaxID=28548 RepID=A0A8H2VQ98_9HELO|nr:595de35d-e164-4649-8e05-f4ded1339401 [Sclerotinia trifoliorum]